MFIGILLILTWLILLLRYPAKALPVSLAAAAGLGIVAAIVIWQDSRETRQLERLDIQLGYDPLGCPADKTSACLDHQRQSGCAAGAALANRGLRAW